AAWHHRADRDVEVDAADARRRGGEYLLADGGLLLGGQRHALRGHAALGLGGALARAALLGLGRALLAAAFALAGALLGATLVALVCALLRAVLVRGLTLLLLPRLALLAAWARLGLGLRRTSRSL